MNKGRPGAFLECGGLLGRGRPVRTGFAGILPARRASCPAFSEIAADRTTSTAGKMPAARTGRPRSQCGQDVRAPEGRMSVLDGDERGERARPIR